MRKFENCLNCGEEKYIAARGLCYKCYRAEERVRERAKPDLHNPGMRREDKTIFKALSAIMGGLSDLRVVRDDIHDIRKILQPYIEPIMQYLEANPPQTEDLEDPEPPPDPSEQIAERRSLFTVKRDDSGKKPS
jgi:hypothetical protein